MRRQLAKTVLASAVLCVVAALLPAQVGAQAATQPAAQTSVPVKTVVLFSSGVGYFEHTGQVTGNAATELRFKTTQINDILKSLVVQDTGGGKVGTVVYPSQDPLGKTLKSFQIDLTNNPPLADLLNQLRGAKVQLTAGTENLQGTILGVEKKPKAVEKGSIEVWQLDLVTASGTIRTVMLDDVGRIELQDPQLQQELDKALGALAQARDQDKKPVTIRFEGDGQRTVRLGYVVETPIWKTSYRLILQGKGDAKPALQGWAIVENQTDNDWNGVQLSLVSGRPISFIQDLYQPLYVARPVVQPELYASLRPQTYEGGMEMAKAAPLAQAPAGGMGGGGGARSGRARQADAAFGLASNANAPGAAPATPAMALAEQSLDATASVASLASASKVGELFQYTVGDVSLPRQRSAMIPIITDPIDVEKVSIYNVAVMPRNPLNGARVRNTTGKHLLQGPITVLEDGSYAGDARIDNLPPGQERLISYGVDLQMLVNSTKNRQDSSIVSGKIVKGVLNLQYKDVFTQDYVAENKSDKDKTLIIEHPFRQGWKLLEPEKATETTDTLYRFKESVAAGKSATFTIKEQLVRAEVVEILPADFGVLDFYAKNGEMSQTVRDALAKAAAFKQAMTDAQRRVQQARDEIARIRQDQSPIRENLKVIPAKDPLATTLLEKFSKQEKEVDAWEARMKDAQAALEKARKDLEDYVSGLNVG